MSSTACCCCASCIQVGILFIFGALDVDGLRPALSAAPFHNYPYLLLLAPACDLYSTQLENRA